MLHDGYHFAARAAAQRRIEMAAASVTGFLREQYYRLPPALLRAVLVRRHSELWRRSGIVFIHIPRAAGTSINYALYGRFIGHPRATDVKRWAPADVKALPSFAVTRNPWERLVSAYRFAKRGRGVGGVFQARIARPEQFQIPEFDKFDTFVSQWLARRDIRRIDGVFQPQSQFVCDDHGAILVDHVGRLDDLEPTVAFVRGAVGIAPKIGESNLSGDRADYRDLYTSELVRLVGRIYAEDVERFGYKF